MNEFSKNFFVNIALVQARETVIAYFRPVLNEAGITEQQWRIIRLLSENGTLDFQDLSEQASILRPSLTGVLTRLEKMGLVMRLKPASDQRRVFLKLTEEGLQLFDEIATRMEACYAQLEQDFSSEKLQALASLLSDLAKLGAEKEEEKESL